jgi:hypothetical protein
LGFRSRSNKRSSGVSVHPKEGRIKRSAKRNIRLERSGIKCVKKNDIKNWRRGQRKYEEDEYGKDKEEEKETYCSV